MKAQNDCEIIQMNNIDQELVLITNWRAAHARITPQFYVRLARMCTHVFLVQISYINILAYFTHCPNYFEPSFVKICP